MEYQVCTRGVMDTSDPDIRFDGAGVCNHCTDALRRLEFSYFPDKRGEAKLSALIDEINPDPSIWVSLSI